MLEMGREGRGLPVLVLRESPRKSFISHYITTSGVQQELRRLDALLGTKLKWS